MSWFVALLREPSDHSFQLAHLDRANRPEMAVKHALILDLWYLLYLKTENDVISGFNQFPKKSMYNFLWWGYVKSSRPQAVGQ